MSYIVQQEIKGNQYYYLVKNIRQENGWLKAKKYLGKNIPEKSRLQSFEKDLDNVLKAKISGKQPIKQPKYESIQFLKSLEISRIDHTRENGTPKFTPENDIDFLINFTFNSNAIEGSTNSLRDTKIMLKDEKVPNGKKLRDIYEAVNTEDAYKFVKCYENDISKKFILRLHEILMHRLLPEPGAFRKKPVKITGTDFMPPQPEDLDVEVDRFITFYRFIRKKYHPIEVAALVHIKFVQLHPFSDGNGRTARLLMNFVLMKNNFVPIVITRKNRKQYYELLEKTHGGKEYLPFVKFVYDCVESEYEL
ncbi:MAG: Fic family protein [Nanoarchaeota archaeon]|nr:Fic family protein [Nanoarchaeota archaeon]